MTVQKSKETVKAVNSGLHPLFTQRWSPRAFSQKPISDSTLTRIIEAARLAPSCYNEQPWHIYTATPDSFDLFLQKLDSFNQQWAKNAAVLGFLVARKKFIGSKKSNTYAEFDCGSATLSMALQASYEGVYMHVMGGIDHSAAANLLRLPEDSVVLVGFAIGYKGDPESLPTNLHVREKPSDRKGLSEIWQSV